MLQPDPCALAQKSWLRELFPFVGDRGLIGAYNGGGSNAEENA
jgi:hypothetical protein